MKPLTFIDIPAPLHILTAFERASPFRKMEVENLFRSQRLLYRAVEDEDANFMHTIQSDIVSFASSDSGLLKPMTKAESLRHAEFVKNKTLLGVTICLRPPEATSEAAPIPVGSMYLTAPRSGQEHHRNAHISIDIIRPYQRKGYGSEAINWVLDWGFRMAGLHRIEIECFSCR